MLSDHEKQEVIRYLENNQPLPDKYRFLLFDDKREVELVWNGKTNQVSNVVLPFQTIEQVDEPRAETSKQSDPLFDWAGVSLDSRGRQLKGWTNKLIWGDNKLILSSLKNGPLREEIEEQGGIKLIYIDPPFDVGADFSMDIEIGDESFTKKPNVLEELAYRDTWGKGSDSFLSMLYERLILMRDLLADDGSIFVHCDWRVTSSIRLLLDEIFGASRYVNEIIWKRQSAHNDTRQGARHLGRIHDTIHYYRKSDRYLLNMQYEPYSPEQVNNAYKHIESETGRRYSLGDITAPGAGKEGKGNPRYEFLGVTRYWRFSRDRMNQMYRDGKIVQTAPGRVPLQKRYLDEMPGVAIQDLWLGLSPVSPQSLERTGYATQKPETLLERVIKMSSNEGDLVADFFAGSGTMAAVAEKLGRKWIVSDLGKFAIHTTRKRMISVQRELKADGKDYRAFEILNLGKYEREHFIDFNPDLREVEQEAQQQARETAFINLILNAYRAQPTEGFKTFTGRKGGRMVVVGPVNLPVTRLFVDEVIHECRQKRITQVDILGFEYEMGLFPNVLDEAKQKGIDIQPKYIPRDVFDKRAVERDQVVFHDVSFIDVTPHIDGNKVSVELADFSVFYSQDSIANATAELRNGSSRVVVESGQIVKVSKDREGNVSRERLTQSWTDWIDYWAVDFNFENKKEIIRVRNEETGEYEDVWTGDYVFENEWQSFRTRKDRSLELTSVEHECSPGPRKLAVKVVDIFGNDTMTIVEINVGGGR